MLFRICKRSSGAELELKILRDGFDSRLKPNALAPHYSCEKRKLKSRSPSITREILVQKFENDNLLFDKCIIYLLQLSLPEVWGSITDLFKLDTVSPTARHHFDFYSELCC